MRIFFLAAVLFLGVAGLAFVFSESRNSAMIATKKTEEDNAGQSPSAKTPVILSLGSLTGLPCEGAEHRPLAVMLASDPVARPLAGVGEADLVLEMPVTVNQITRLLAFYQCQTPREVGSVRSARHDFLPLAAGFDAIYAHWGGSHFALQELAKGVLDNIDALPNPHNAFYRKRGLPRPHNGFTSYERLLQAAGKLGYRLALSSSLRGSPKGDRGNPDESRNAAGLPRPRAARARNDEAVAQTVVIPYNPKGFVVRWEYDPTSGSYKRFRAGKPEIDKNTGSQVEASVIVVMKTSQKHLEGEYTAVTVIGSGRATIHQNGETLSARWEKEDFHAPLRFLYENGSEAPLLPGKKWVEIIVK